MSTPKDKLPPKKEEKQPVAQDAVAIAQRNIQEALRERANRMAPRPQPQSTEKKRISEAEEIATHNVPATPAPKAGTSAKDAEEDNAILAVQRREAQEAATQTKIKQMRWMDNNRKITALALAQLAEKQNFEVASALAAADLAAQERKEADEHLARRQAEELASMDTINQLAQHTLDDDEAFARTLQHLALEEAVAPIDNDALLAPQLQAEEEAARAPRRAPGQ